MFTLRLGSKFNFVLDYIRFLWLMSTLDHKRVSALYFIFGVWGGFFGLSLSFMIRLNFLDPYINVIPTNIYNSVVTSHGVSMIFFFLMPILIGSFGNYLLPLLIGSNDLSLPRTNSLSVWLLVPSSILLVVSMFGGNGVGWTFYPPLSGFSYSSWGVDFLMFSLHLAGLSSLIGSVNFVCTLFDPCDDFTMFRTSIMAWAYFFTSILLVISLPVLAAGITMLLFDRNFGSAFFDPAGGGDPVLFQHLFWFFGHPEVYVLILPAFGIVSYVCTCFSDNDCVYGYHSMIFAMLSIVCLGSVVWGHHMFMVGFDSLTSLFFSSVTMIIGLPTGVKVFSWLIMLCDSGRYSDEIALWWIISFISLFTVGGVTGLALSCSVLDSFLHDTWFVVAHFHYVLSLGSYSSVVILLIWWWPYVTGFTMNLYLMQAHFFSSTIGFNVCFFPMHFLGLNGLPRRVCCYDCSFYILNTICNIGSLVSVCSGFFLMFVIWDSIATGHTVISIWGGSTDPLTAVRCPPPHHATYGVNPSLFQAY